jgi:predicted enzyme related to lactoylglutathione lyase
MADTSTSNAAAGIAHKPGSPCWVDVASNDVEASGRFYSGLFGWKAEPVPDPEAGGYTFLTLGGDIVAALSPLQEGQVPAWTVYFKTPDAEATGALVEEFGGKVVVPAFDVLKSGRMAVFQDPKGAYLAVWQPKEMPGFSKAYEPNTFGWAELNEAGVASVVNFYTSVFGWEVKLTEGGDGSPPYVEWQIDGQSIGGAIDLAEIPDMPSDMPPFWLVYFLVSDIEASTKKVSELGGVVQKGPQPYPGGQFTIASDPSGAAFALMQMDKSAQD